jgi:hypothetical protein
MAAVLALRAGGAVVPARRLVVVGLLAGVAATLVYDISRLGVHAVGGFDTHPFKAFPLFGAALAPSASPAGQLVVGTAFHAVNGLGFGLAYTLLCGRCGVGAAIAFGLALEAAMVALYPSWLQLDGLGEFLTMSVLGHLGYGATLGWSAQRLLRAPRGEVGRDGHRAARGAGLAVVGQAATRRSVVRPGSGLGGCRRLLADGHTRAGALAPLLSLAAGVAIAVWRPGFDVAVTESLLVLLGMAAVGIAAGQLGVWLMVGFAVADLANGTWLLEAPQRWAEAEAGS